jgi:hypothetical protein
MINLEASFEIETAQTLAVKNWCGTTCYTVQPCDTISQVNLEGELAILDFELLELLTGNELVRDITGTVIGMKVPSEPCNDGVYLEVYTQAVFGSGSCPVPAQGGNLQWYRWIFPRAFLRFGDVTFENGFANASFTGYSKVNRNLPQGGPYSDWNFVPSTWDPKDQMHISLVGNIPSTDCGYVPITPIVSPIAVADTIPCQADTAPIAVADTIPCPVN